MTDVIREPGVTVIAHRGASARFRENTLEAFRGAIACHAHGVELDVRRLADGSGAVHHDAHLADGPALVDLMPDDLPAHVPSLAVALDACGPLLVNVEIKNWRTDSDFDPSRDLADWTVAEVLRVGDPTRVVVSSFDLATIDRVRELAPQIATAWLFSRGEPTALVAHAAERGHGGVHPLDRMVDGPLVAAAHEQGLFISAWTVDDPVRIRGLADLGVDGIITNVPDIALAALAAR